MELRQCAVKEFLDLPIALDDPEQLELIGVADLGDAESLFGRIGRVADLDRIERLALDKVDPRTTVRTTSAKSGPAVLALTRLAVRRRAARVELGCRLGLSTSRAPQVGTGCDCLATALTPTIVMLVLDVTSKACATFQMAVMLFCYRTRADSAPHAVVRFAC